MSFNFIFCISLTVIQKLFCSNCPSIFSFYKQVFGVIFTRTNLKNDLKICAFDMGILLIFFIIFVNIFYFIFTVMGVWKMEMSWWLSASLLVEILFPRSAGRTRLAILFTGRRKTRISESENDLKTLQTNFTKIL